MSRPSTEAAAIASASSTAASLPATVLELFTNFPKAGEENQTAVRKQLLPLIRKALGPLPIELKVGDSGLFRDGFDVDATLGDDGKITMASGSLTTSISDLQEKATPPLESKVQTLCKYMASKRVSDEQRILLAKSINNLFDNRIQPPLTAKTLAAAGVLLVKGITRKYPVEENKLRLFLDAIESEMKDKAIFEAYWAQIPKHPGIATIKCGEEYQPLSSKEDNAYRTGILEKRLKTLNIDYKAGDIDRNGRRSFTVESPAALLEVIEKLLVRKEIKAHALKIAEDASFEADQLTFPPVKGDKLVAAEAQAKLAAAKVKEVASAKVSDLAAAMAPALQQQVARTVHKQLYEGLLAAPPSRTQ